MNSADRATFVAAECGDDRELRAEVEHLLESGDAADDAGFMDEPLCRLGMMESNLPPPSSDSSSWSKE
ncbi:hypothetical protein ACFL2H_07950 [Planctomycetota bacterium]